MYMYRYVWFYQCDRHVCFSFHDLYLAFFSTLQLKWGEVKWSEVKWSEVNGEMSFCRELWTYLQTLRWQEDQPKQRRSDGEIQIEYYI